MRKARVMTKKELGFKTGSVYYYERVSVKKFLNGYIIKPTKNNRIIINKDQAKLIALHLRNKNELFTYDEIKKKFSKLAAEQI